MNNNLEKPAVKNNETSEQKDVREERERLEETKKFKQLCVDYHARNSSDWNMNSYAKDSQLYKQFLKIDIKKLPAALKPVYLHRLAYVQAIAQLGKNKKVRAFALKFMGLSESDLGGKFELLYGKVKDSAEFKALTKSDFNEALIALKGSMALLSRIPAGGKWGPEAAMLLKPDNVDDVVAHVRLSKGFNLISANVSKLQRKAVTS